MTIRPNKYGFIANYDIGIGGVPVKYQNVHRVQVDLQPGCHDMLTIDIDGIPPRAITDYIGAPVQFNINTGPGYSYDFAGSVVTTNPVAKTAGGLVDQSPFQRTTMTCLGVSYDMRGNKTRDWSGQSISDVAVSLAKHYRLSVDVPKLDIINNTMLQTGESDWQFVNRYADRYGLKVTCHGTHMHLFDPERFMGRNISLHPILSPRSLTGMSRPVPGSVIEFKGDFSERSYDGKYMSAIAPVFTDEGDVFEVTSEEVFRQKSPARYRSHLADNLSSYEEAVRAIKKTTQDKYDYMAHISVVGLAGCLPGGMVDIKDYKGDVDGIWYVRKVKHVLTNEMFVTDIDVARNKEQNPNRLAAPPFTQPPVSSFVDNSFRASRGVYRVY
jgi:hypothetical protein